MAFDKIQAKAIDTNSAPERGSVTDDDFVLIRNSNTGEFERVKVSSLLSGTTGSIRLSGEADFTDPSTTLTSVVVNGDLDNSTIAQGTAPTDPNPKGVAYLVKAAESGATTEISGASELVFPNDQVVWTGNGWAVVASGRQVTSVNGQTGAVTVDLSWSAISGKPTVFPTDWADVSGKPAFATRWPDYSEITNVPASLPSDWADITNKPATFPTSWNGVSGKPSNFPTEWTLVSGKPTTFPTTWDEVADKPTVIEFGALPTGYSYSKSESDTRYYTKTESDTNFLPKTGIAADSQALEGRTFSEVVDEATQGAVPSTRTINGQELSGDITLTKSDLGLSNVNNWGASSAVNSSSTTTYATSAAVKTAYDRATSALNQGGTKLSGVQYGPYVRASGRDAQAIIDSWKARARGRTDTLLVGFTYDPYSGNKARAAYRRIV